MGRSTLGRNRARPWLGLLALGLGCGCATGLSEARARPVAALVEALQEGGGAAEHPFVLDPKTLEEARRLIGLHGTAEGRMERVVQLLNGGTGQAFRYVPNITLSARQAYRERVGDCMTYAMLAVALARSVGVPAYFVYVSELPVHYDASGWLFSASHIAVGLGSGSRSLVVDFTASGDGLPSSLYRAVDDVTAASLFFNNLAVERLVAADAPGAERMLRRLVAFSPEVREPWANLGVVLLRQGNPEASLALLQEALGRFPDYQPLWTNAVRVARSLGDEARAKQLEAEAERVAHADPYFHFMRGVSAHQAGDSRTAIASLERAVRSMAEGSLVRAWLVRAYLAGGEHQRGSELFATLRRELPGDPLLDVLVREFPQLALVDGPATPSSGTQRLVKKVRRKP